MSEKILVVDDKVPNRYAVVRVLQRAGYEVLEATTGREAMLAAQQQPALIVLDVHLPDMIGFEVSEHLRADPSTAQIAILHVSASFTTTAAQAMGLRRGADAYLVHPIDPDVLLATVQALLRLRRAERIAREALAREQEARAEAEAGRALMNAIVEGTTDAIFVKDLAGCYVMINSAGAGLLGRDKADVIGKHDRELFSGEMCESIVADDRRIVASGTAQMIEEVGTLAGKTRTLLTNKAPYRDSQGRIAGVIGVSRDITERAALVRELQETVRSREELLTIASHDLRGPLSALRIKVQLLRRAVAEPVEPRALGGDLEFVERQVDRLVRLLDALLDVTRLTSGEVQMDLQPIDLRVLIEDVVERVRDESRAASAVTVRGATSVVGRWDAVRVGQIVSNLLSNATKYGGGRPIEVTLTADEAKATVSVRDQGIGISPRDQDRIFRRFERGSQDDRPGSFGVGLWIVRKLVAALGGDIRLESSPGQGSIFSVELPLAGPSQVAVDSPVLH